MSGAAVEPPPLSEWTTLRLGGRPRRFVVTHTATQLAAEVAGADAGGEPVFVLGGGSNVVVADEGFDGVVVKVASRGIVRHGDLLRVEAGESWDDFVAYCVTQGLAGVECLSGIPGSVGAAPIQNVGAYQQAVEKTIVEVTALERGVNKVVQISKQDCQFGYRDSIFKRDRDRWVILRVSFLLEPSTLSAPLRAEEIRNLVGSARAPLAAVREATMSVRRRKGMLLDDADRDTWSVGSFFINPVVTDADIEAISRRVGQQPPRLLQDDGSLKTAAAWLVEAAGFEKGQSHGRRAAISSKHALALTNRGEATTAELMSLAREIADRVRSVFDISLVPEPTFIGHTW